MKRKENRNTGFPENDWMEDIEEYYSSSLIHYQNRSEGQKNGFPPKKCPICRVRYDGTGHNEQTLPYQFSRLPMVSRICYKCKKKKKTAGTVRINS